MFENYTDYLFTDKIILKSQQIFKSNHHKVYTEEVDKIDWAVMMIRDYKHLMWLKHIHTEQMRLKCMKVKC